MIDQFALNKALLDKLVSVTNLDIAIFGDGFKPDPTKSYIAEKEVPTSATQVLGVGSDSQRGFYQVTLATPINKAKFYHLQTLDNIKSFWIKGLGSAIEFNNQKVSITNVSTSSIYSDDTHLKTAITINYFVSA